MIQIRLHSDKFSILKLTMLEFIIVGPILYNRRSFFLLRPTLEVAAKAPSASMANNILEIYMQLSPRTLK